MNARMRILLVLAVLVVAGLVGLVVHHESTKTKSTPITLGSPGKKVETISHGEDISIEAQLVDGQWTVIEFGAEW